MNINRAGQRAALGSMVDKPLWFIFRLTPDLKKPGHYEKVPCFTNGAPGFKHLEEQLMTFDAACAWCDNLNAAAGAMYPANLAYTPGFSMREGCGYWCLDVDDAFTPDRQWASDHARDLYAMLVTHYGCTFEVSSSGLGYHVFGAGTLPPHRKKNTKLGIELYTEGRGMALGLDGQMSGVLDNPHATAYVRDALIPTFFPFDGTSEGRFAQIDFLDTPLDSRWRGPASDEELLRRAMQSQGMAAKFGNGVTFSQLWNDVPELSKFYEGRSEIDQALLQHLAFWTGCNPVRMERLMQQSPLKREKWLEPRGDLTWLQTSILKQCNVQSAVLQDKEVDVPVTITPGVEKDAVGERVERKSILNLDDQVELFRNIVYVINADAMFVANREGYGTYLNKSKFDSVFGGRSFFLDLAGTICKQSAWDAFTRSQDMNFPKVDKAVFDPRKPSMKIFNEDGEICLNSYVKPIVKHVAAEPGEIEEHLFALVSKLLPDPNDQAILLYYMAAVVQHQGEKFRWCPVMQGVQGNGKSTLANMLQHAVGKGLYHRVRSSNLLSKFNGWLFGKTLLIVDDVRLERRDKMALELLKPLITEEYAEIEKKGVDQAMMRVCGNFFMSMNDKAGIPRENNERRYAIFYCAQQCEEDVARDMPPVFFAKLYKWLQEEDGYAKVAHWLANVEIPYEYNPATGCQRAPKTSSEDEIAEVNRDELEVIVRGAIETECAGFCGGFVSLGKLKELAKDGQLSAGHRRIEAMFASLGYIKHPHLRNGRPDNPISAEGNKRPTLYVLANHPTASPEYNGKMSEIARMYTEANYGQHAGGLQPPEEIPPEYQNYNL